MSVGTSDAGFATPLKAVPALIVSSRGSLGSAMLIVAFYTACFSTLILSGPGILFLVACLDTVIFYFFWLIALLVGSLYSRSTGVL